MTEPTGTQEGRQIPRKNTPFLAQQRYLARKKAADAKKDASHNVSKQATISFVDAAKWLLIALAANFILSRMITETWFWTHTAKWANPRNYLPKRRPLQSFTEAELAQFDGTDPEKPIYLGLDGFVFDVTAGRRIYGPGGSYHHFAGRDAARAFVTGCFKTQLTHDIRGFDNRQLETLGGWKQFYSDHGRYFRIGNVLHDPVDPESPLPDDCDAKAEGGAV